MSAGPRAIPSRRNCTLATATLSVALADTVTLDPLTVEPLAGAVILTVGGVVSAGGTLSTVTFTTVDVVVLPAASRATAVRLWAPSEAETVFQITV